MIFFESIIECFLLFVLHLRSENEYLAQIEHILSSYNPRVNNSASMLTVVTVTPTFNLVLWALAGPLCAWVHYQTHEAFGGIASSCCIACHSKSSCNENGKRWQC